MLGVVVSAVREDVDAGGAAEEEGLPPPVVVLRVMSVFVYEVVSGVERTSAQSWIYTYMTVVSITARIRIVETTAKKPKT